MKWRKPSYFEEFSCIGGDCEDTCCAGWYLPVDETTYKKYKKVKDPMMKKRLDKEIVAKKGNVTIDNVAKIKLKNNKCAFLNCEGLCDIYLKLGQNYMSESCNLYPRTFNKVNDVVECSLTMSCPEAARKILLSEDGISFKNEDNNEKHIHVSAELSINEGKPREIRDYLIEIRNLLIGILQDRSRPFRERFEYMLVCFKTISDLAAKGSLKKISEYTAKVVKSDYRYIQEGKAINVWAKSHHELILQKLKSMREAKKWPSSDYEKIYEDIISVFKDEKQFKQEFKTGYSVYERVFLKEYEYILENYFVNYIFEREVPLDGDSLDESISYLRLYYEIIELHLVGLSKCHNDNLDKAKVVRCLSLFTRVFDHNELYRKQLLSVVSNK